MENFIVVFDDQDRIVDAYADCLAKLEGGQFSFAFIGGSSGLPYLGAVNGRAELGNGWYAFAVPGSAIESGLAATTGWTQVEPADQTIAGRVTYHFPTDSIDPDSLVQYCRWQLSGEVNPGNYTLKVSGPEAAVREISVSHDGVIMTVTDAEGQAETPASNPLPVTTTAVPQDPSVTDQTSVPSAPATDLATNTEATTNSDEEPATELEAALAELDALTGIQPVKDTIRELTDSVKVAQWRRAAGLRADRSGNHMVFIGTRELERQL